MNLSVAFKPEEKFQPHLRPVKSSLKRDKINPLFLALTAVLGVVLILGAQLWLNLSVSSGAYEISELTVQERELSRIDRALQLDVNRLSSPQNLAIEATELGMVQNYRPAYLLLADNKIAGSIEQSTTAAKNNTVQNSALKDLQNKKPITVNTNLKKNNEKENSKKKNKTDATQTPKKTENTSSTPVVWEGKLVAPNTH